MRKIKRWVMTLVAVTIVATGLGTGTVQASNNAEINTPIAIVDTVKPELTNADLAADVVRNKILAQKSNYPEGMRFTNADPKGGYRFNVLIDDRIYYGYGCAAFAFMMSDVAFEDLPARKITPDTYDSSTIRVGDILRIKNNSHSVVVLEVKTDRVVVCEANYNYSVHWGREITYKALNDGTTNYILTRYPEGYSSAGWIYENGYWKYKYEDGSYATGWAQIEEKWYLFDKSSIMLNNWQLNEGKWYYLGTDGAMATGWKQIGGKWYYLESSGAMATGWKQIGGKWYYLESSGAMATGWKQISEKWYYLESSGAMATGWKQIGGKWYYLESSGAMVTGWKQIGGKWYYLESSGAMATGWKQINGTWYYMKSSGVMATGTVKIGSKNYRFSSSGAWIK